MTEGYIFDSDSQVGSFGRGSQACVEHDLGSIMERASQTERSGLGVLLYGHVNKEEMVAEPRCSHTEFCSAVLMLSAER